MTTRLDRARELIRADLPPAFELREICTTEWLERFPGGFTPIASADVGEIWEYCPRRIVDLGTDLTDEQFDAFCWAIQDWQRLTLMDFMMIRTPETIVLKFLSDHPNDAHLLTVMAARAGLPLTSFLGADR